MKHLMKRFLLSLHPGTAPSTGARGVFAGAVASRNCSMMEEAEVVLAQ